MLSRPGHSQLGAGSVWSTFCMVDRLQNRLHRLWERLRVASRRWCWNGESYLPRGPGCPGRTG